MCPLEVAHRCTTTVAALLAPGDAPLCLRQVLFAPAVMAWILDRVALGGDEEHLEAHVDARFVSSGQQGLGRHIGTGEHDVPAVGFLAHRDRFGRAVHWPRPTHGEAPNLAQDEIAVIQLDTVAILLVGETVVAVAPLKARETWLFPPRQTTEERLVRLVQPREHILQDVCVDRSVLREIRPQVLQLCFLLVARDRDAAPLPSGDALLQRRIVERAAAPQVKLQRPLLLGRRLQPVLVALAHALGHDYRPLRSVCCSRDTYSCNAQTISPVNERRCAAARAFIASMRVCGSWMVTLRCWCLDVSMPALCHTCDREAKGPGLSAQATNASPLGLKPSGLRRG